MEYTFTPGITRLEIPVVINDDNSFEQIESFRAQLMTSRPGVIIDMPMTTIDIWDNDCEWLVDVNFVAITAYFLGSESVCMWEGGRGYIYHSKMVLLNSVLMLVSFM